MPHRATHAVHPAVTRETFYSVFMADTGRGMPYNDARDCPLVANDKCDCSTAIREFSLSAQGGHPCGEGGKCPARTYLHLRRKHLPAIAEAA